MKKMTKLYTFVFLCIITVSCSDPVKVPVGQLCNDQYKGMNIVTEAIVQVPPTMITVSTGYTVDILLGDPERKVTLTPYTIFPGVSENKPNSAKKLPDGDYTEDDIEVYDKNGKIIHVGDKVRITGEMKGTSKGFCFLQLDEIEKID